MATQITAKAGFAKWIQENITDEQIIMLTNDMVGSVSVKQKINQKKVSFAFAADSFKRKDDIGHIAFKETPALSFIICNKEYASQETLDMIEILSKRSKNKK